MILNSIRERKGLTIRELSQMAGVSTATIINIEKGRTKGYPSTLKKLANALNVSIEKLTKE